MGNHVEIGCDYAARFISWLHNGAEHSVSFLAFEIIFISDLTWLIIILCDSIFGFLQTERKTRKTETKGEREREEEVEMSSIKNLLNGTIPFYIIWVCKSMTHSTHWEDKKNEINKITNSLKLKAINSNRRLQ